MDVGILWAARHASGASQTSILIFDGKGKRVPVLNKAPRQEDLLGSGGIAPRILDLGTRCR